MQTQLPAARAVPELFASNGNVQVIYPGTAVDQAYNASGGASVRVGPLSCSVIRLAVATSSSFRFAIGDNSVAATATDNTLFVGPGVESFGFVPGNYIAFISNDATTGTVNITQAG